MSTPTDFVRALVAVAQKERQDFGGKSESDPPLQARIRRYCADLGFPDPGDISEFPWSAVFVSWCLQAAGATPKEFKFSPRHAVFVKWAIANLDGGKGLFRGHAIDARAPELGDVIARNRGGGNVTYADARVSDSYVSHSAIVVDFPTLDGVSYAATVGGNEGNTVGRSLVELKADGTIKQRAVDPFIVVIENRKDSIDAAAIPALVALNIIPSPDSTPGTVSGAFRRHGTFIYDVDETVADYGSEANVAAAMTRAGMSHAWVRIHGTSAYPAPKKKRIASLIDALGSAGIAVAGWGWCQGADAAGDARLALQELDAFGLQDYLADIEEGVANAHWSVDEVREFCAAVRAGVEGSFAITTFPLIDWHNPELMQAASPFVDAFAPQVYWFTFPNTRMVKEFRRPDGSKYRANDPAEYAELCLDRWDALSGGKPLVLTGQAYWGEGGLTQAEAEARLEAFLGAWKNHDRIIGLNWWHFGGGAAMSHRMLEAIVAADLGAKAYAK